MAKPTASQVHVNTPLTNISVAYMQSAEDFVARRVFPNVPVQHQSDRYYIYDRADFNRDQAEKRAPGTESAGGGYTLDNSPNYFCDVWAIHKDVDDQIMANSDPVLRPDRDATEWVTQQLMIRQEVEWVSTYFTGGVWTAGDLDGVNASPGTSEFLQWDDDASTPIEDIRTGKTTIKQNTGMKGNTLVVSQAVMDALVDHPDIVDRVKYSGGVGNTSPAMVNEQTLAALFGLDRVMVASAVQNTAAESLTESSSFIAGKKALLCHAAPNPGIMTPTAGYTFSWRNYLNVGNEMGVAISRFRMDHLKSDRVEGEIAMDFELVSSDLGYFFDNAVA